MNAMALYQRRMVYLASAPFMVFVLARFLFVVGVPWGLLNVNAIPVFTHPHLHKILLSVPKAAPVAAPVVNVGTVLQLRSTLRDYRMTFSGQVTCAEAPCQAELHLSINSDHNEDLKQVFQTTPDGRFEHNMTVQETAGQPADWRIMVYTPSTYPVEIHGRQILADDSDINVERSIRLP